MQKWRIWRSWLVLKTNSKEIMKRRLEKFPGVFSLCCPRIVHTQYEKDKWSVDRKDI